MTDAAQPKKPLVITCRLTVPNDVDLLDIYRQFTSGHFTVLEKSDLYPNKDGETGRFYLELFIWPIREEAAETEILTDENHKPAL